MAQFKPLKGVWILWLLILILTGELGISLRYEDEGTSGETTTSCHSIAIVWQRAKTCRNKQPQFPWGKKKKYQWTTLTILSQTMWMLHYYCHAKSWLLGKDSDAGRDWGQEQKGTTKDEMAGWHHWLDGHESEWTPGDGDVQGGLACCDSWGGKDSDTTERLNWTVLKEVNIYKFILI